MQGATKPRYPLIGSRHQGTRGRVGATTAGLMGVWTGFRTGFCCIVGPQVGMRTYSRGGGRTAYTRDQLTAAVELARKGTKLKGTC